jgi:hypothetical protein
MGTLCGAGVSMHALAAPTDAAAGITIPGGRELVSAGLQHYSQCSGRVTGNEEWKGTDDLRR